MAESLSGRGTYCEQEPDGTWTIGSTLPGGKLTVGPGGVFLPEGTVITATTYAAPRIEGPRPSGD
jgi:hypothetical protein